MYDERQNIYLRICGTTVYAFTPGFRINYGSRSICRECFRFSSNMGNITKKVSQFVFCNGTKGSNGKLVCVCVLLCD